MVDIIVIDYDIYVQNDMYHLQKHYIIPCRPKPVCTAVANLIKCQ